MKEIRLYMVCEGENEEDGPIRSALNAAAMLKPSFEGMPRECFWAIYLDVRHRVIGKHLVSMGSLTGTTVHPREVYAPAIMSVAAAVICIHNHPSADPAPSPEDIQITKQLVEAGNILGIRLLDHIIFAGDKWLSFAEENLM